MNTVHTLTSRLGITKHCRICQALIADVVPMLQIRHKTTHNKRYKAPNEAKVREKRESTKKLLTPFENPQDSINEEWLARRPEDTVWINTYYPRQKFTITEAITRHQEYAQPAMFDSLDNFLFADLSLNMATNKKTKFLSPMKHTVLMPRRFSYKELNRCIVFCQTDEQIECALKHGAEYAGSDKLIKMIQDETITTEDFEFVLSTPDMITKIATLRPKFRDVFPQEKQGTINVDVAEMVINFTNGITIESQPTTSESVSRLQMPIGQLKMNADELAENFKQLIVSLAANRPVKGAGEMVLDAFLLAPPSPERFYLHPSEVADGRVKQRRRARKEEEEIEDSVDDEAEMNA